MNRITEDKHKYVLTLGLSRIVKVNERLSVEENDPKTIVHSNVMLTQEESVAWYRMIEAIIVAQVKEKNKQWKR